MGWKDWSYAVRGAIIGVVVGLLRIIFGNIFTYIYFSNSKLLNVNPSFGAEGLARIIIYAIPVLFIYFLIGALIGWIIGKIKSSRDNAKNE